ncbi:unnamed protein product, partial [Allacma fusca]
MEELIEGEILTTLRIEPIEGDTDGDDEIEVYGVTHGVGELEVEGSTEKEQKMKMVRNSQFRPKQQKVRYSVIESVLRYAWRNFHSKAFIAPALSETWVLKAAHMIQAYKEIQFTCLERITRWHPLGMVQGNVSQKN